ncbi:MAG: zinc ribbon domain-containing protein [Chlamydiae bacterium]|nr:MAG: zinc ribbon domain-containing protein [Chlamydiota bacterium]
MPTYEYECKNCKYVFEAFQSMSAKPLRKCPKCGGKVKRLIGTGSGIIFKGSGFYETDYKRNNSVQTSQPKKEEKVPEKKTETKKSNSKKKK